MKTVRRLPLIGVFVAMGLAGALLTGCDTPAKVLSGHVTVTTTGHAAAGVPVTAYSNASQTVVATTSTNAQGAYAFTTTDLPDATYRIRFGADAWWDGASTWAAATPATIAAASPTTIDDSVTSGSITGTAQGPSGALDGATVTAINTDTGNTTATTQTATGGTYTVADLPTGTYHLRFAKTGSTTRYSNSTIHYSDAPTVTVSSGATTSSIDTTLAAESTITGTIISDGPVGGALVFALDPSDGRPLTGVTTASDGTFTLGGLNPVPTVLRVGKTGYVTQVWGSPDNQVPTGTQVTPPAGAGHDVGTIVLIGEDCTPTETTTCAPQTPHYTEQNIAADRTSNQYSYRIPALAYLGDGVVLASWDARPGGSGDAPNPNSIVQRRSTDGGHTWGPMTTVAAGRPAAPKYGYSDPSYVVDRETGDVFNFFVYSKDAGFASSQFGNNDADRDIISAAVVTSTDGGLTWSSPRLITNVVKPGTSRTNPQTGDVKSMFAASGEGIQLRYGAYAGRLIQQYSGYVRQSNGTNAFQAYSVYSDDHGATWQMGQPVGTGMDENKVVELSDGRVMLNSRDSSNSRFRKVAISTDGGHSYGPVTIDRQLIDPTNNGSITRLYPDAEQDSPAAKRLLFVNAANQSTRRDVSAKVSCDDGVTWPGRRLIRNGFSAYATATRLDGGRIGVFFEASYTNDMEFAAFNDAWLNYVCAPISTPDRTVPPGTTAQVPVTITNQEMSALAAGTATISVPSGWSASTATVPALAPGRSTTVMVDLTAPSSANGSQRLEVVYSAADGRTSHHDMVVSTQGVPRVGLTITGTPESRDVNTNPYTVGEQVAYTLRVTSTANVTANVVPVSGSFENAGFLPPAAPNCRWISLGAGAAYNCTTPRHVVAAAELSAGYFIPTATFTVTSSSDSSLTETVTFTGDPVPLRAP